MSKIKVWLGYPVRFFEIGYSVRFFAIGYPVRFFEIGYTVRFFVSSVQMDSIFYYLLSYKAVK